MDRFRFRAWDKENRCWLNDDEFSIEPDGTVRVVDGDKPKEDGPVTLMQSTGLRDKNGKLIYEGDVVEVNVLNGQFTGVFVVEYHGHSFLMCKPGHNKDGIDQAWYYDATAIGNIYENLDLIGG